MYVVLPSSAVISADSADTRAHIYIYVGLGRERKNELSPLTVGVDSNKSPDALDDNDDDDNSLSACIRSGYGTLCLP